MTRAMHRIFSVVKGSLSSYTGPAPDLTPLDPARVHPYFERGCEYTSSNFDLDSEARGERESRRAIEAYEKEAISQLDYEKAQDELESAQYAHQHAVADRELTSERLAFEQRTKQLEVEQQALLVDDLERQVDELTAAPTHLL